MDLSFSGAGFMGKFLPVSLSTLRAQLFLLRALLARIRSDSEETARKRCRFLLKFQLTV